MSTMTKLLHKLHHPVWWEDVIPGALMAAPKVMVRLAAFSVVPHAILSL